MTQRKFDFIGYVNRERAERTSFVKLDLPAGAAMGYDKWVIINRILYWMDYNQSHNKTKNFQDGRWWTYNSYKGWHEDMPGITERNMRDHFKWLEKHHLVITGNYNDKRYDDTKWYTVSVNVVHQFFDVWWEQGCPEVNQMSEEYRNFLSEWQKVFDELYPLTDSVTPPDGFRHPPLTDSVTPIPVEETVYKSVEELKTPQSAGRPEPAAAPDSFVEKTPAKKVPPTPPARIPGKVGVRGTNYKGDDDVQYTGDTFGDEATSRAVNSFAHDFLLGIYNFGKLSVGAARQKNFNKTIQTRLTRPMLIGMVPRKSPDHYLTNFEECREYVREELQKTLVKPIQDGRIEKVNYFIDNAYKFIAAWVSAELARQEWVKAGNEIRIAFTSPDGYPHTAIWREGNVTLMGEDGLESQMGTKSKDEFIEHYQNKLNGKIVKNTEEVEL